ncbi:MAG: DUF3326 domain-containing protein [Rhodospirillaceae bacterium]|jgi:hypothetical protein|nr:DUF3326 domain-containing protein [Rhodospirillaceae bacterium]MBT5938429.1 DUF3326 domain-containing protein [Rhodospirillaceae bacterium]MBT7266808.1 DUF3326 domain-containing protein [Rhodospirillaceae bacterium]
MHLTEQKIPIPISPGHRNMLDHIQKAIDFRFEDGTIPVRFAITGMDETHYHCEFGVLDDLNVPTSEEPDSIFRFVRRKIERTDAFNAVFLVPTGIGAEIGGHAGDATPAARVLAEACDKLITHPNVVNASDLNEMPENSLYVEGSAITRLMMGTAALQPVRSNRVLVIMDDHEIEMFANDTVNAVSAARATYGLDCPKIIKLDPPLCMAAEFMQSGRAAGEITGLERVLAALDENLGTFDAVAIASVIDLDDETHEEYFHRDGEMANPWGGVEAMLTHAVSMLYEIPTAHSPMLESHKVANFDLGLVEPRLAAEAVSLTFVQCMLKGLHRSPRIVTDADAMREPGMLSAADVSCLVMPDKCVGLPTLAALEQGIPVIAIRENDNLMQNDLQALPWAPGQLHLVENYWEAVGVMTALKSGITPSSLRRPLAATKIEKRKFETQRVRLDESIKEFKI